MAAQKGERRPKGPRRHHMGSAQPLGKQRAASSAPWADGAKVDALAALLVVGAHGMCRRDDGALANRRLSLGDRMQGSEYTRATDAAKHGLGC